MRREFEMSQEDLDGIIKASQPTPYMTDSTGRLLFGTPQENANRAWASLGRKMGFKHMTVQPLPAKGNRFFTAEETVVEDSPKFSGALPPEPIRRMLDGSPCWCVSKDEPHEGWVHAPFCLRLRAHEVADEEAMVEIVPEKWLRR